MNGTPPNIRERMAQALRSALEPAVNRVSAALDPIMARARARYEKLEPRERLFVKLLGVLFGAFFLYDLIYLPVRDYRENLKVKIEARRHELGEARELVDTYLRRQGELKLTEKRTLASGKDFSLFSAIESSLTKTVGRDRIGSITPRPDRKLADGFTQHSVELKLTGVTLAQIVEGLYGVGHLSAPVAVSSLRITRRTGDTHVYDVDLTCVAVSRNG